MSERITTPPPIPTEHLGRHTDPQMFVGQVNNPDNLTDGVWNAERNPQKMWGMNSKQQDTLHKKWLEQSGQNSSDVEPFDISDVFGIDSDASIEETRRAIKNRIDSDKTREADEEEPEPNNGRYGLSGDELVDRITKVNPEYDGPVTPGMEVELHDGIDTRGDEEEHDPRRDEDTLGFYYDDESQEWVKQFEIPGFDNSQDTPDRDRSEREMKLESSKNKLARLEAEASAKGIRRLGIDDSGEQKGFLRRALSKTKRGLKKITGIDAIQNKIRKSSDKELEQARAEYQELFNELAGDIAQQMEADGLSQEEIRMASLVGQTYHDHSIDELIEQFQSDPRHGIAKETNKSNNWWHSASGKKKFAAVFGVGLAAGATVATAGALIPFLATGWAGTIAGGGVVGKGAGLFTARYYNKRRSTAVIGHDEQGIAITNANQRRQWSEGQKSSSRNDAFAAGDFVQNEGSMASMARLTDYETDKNRLDYGRSAAAGALGGLAGGALVRVVLEQLGIGDNNPDPTGSGDGDNKPKPTPEDNFPPADVGEEPDDVIGIGRPPEGATPINPEDFDPTGGNTPAGGSEIQGLEFQVEAGNGVQTEINDFLEANGYGRNDSISAELLAKANEQFPGGLMEYNSTGEGWNEFITSPGPNSFKPGVAEFFMQELAK